MGERGSHIRMVEGWLSDSIELLRLCVVYAITSLFSAHISLLKIYVTVIFRLQLSLYFVNKILWLCMESRVTWLVRNKWIAFDLIILDYRR